MSRRLTSTLSVTTLACLIGWLSVVGAAQGAEQVLKLGITPREAPRVMFTKFSPLAAYLSKELGQEVQLVIGKDFQATIEGLGKNEFQLALLTPSAYPKCEKLYPDAGVRPLVRFLSGKSGTYTTCFFVPAGSGLSSLGELKGKSVALGDATSAAANWMPRAMLKAAGVDPDKDLAACKCVGSHTNVASAVAMKSFDAGACMDSTAERFEKEGKIKIIARSEPMPDAPICANKHLSGELSEKVKQAFLKLKAGDADGKAVLSPINEKYSGCEAVEAKDYDSIRALVQKLFGDQWYSKSL